MIGEAYALQWGRDLSITEGVVGRWRYSARAWLQWGRDLSITEGQLIRIFTRFITELQWGRDLSITEGTIMSSLSREPCGFNGAAIFRSRKEPSSN